MKKSIFIVVLLALFVFVGNDVSAQTDKTTTRMEATAKAAIKIIENDKRLSDADKEKFVKRLTVLSNPVKADDKKTKIEYEQEYNRIASNYARITKKSLPALETTKSGN